MNHRSEGPVGVVLEILRGLNIEAKVITGKHHKVRFHVNGKKRTYTVPISTRDGRRALKDCRRGIERLLRKDGIVSE